MAALQRALALHEGHHGAVLVAEQLNLDVPGPADAAFKKDRRVAERRARLGPRRPNCAGQFRRRHHDAHALAATTRHGLHHQRVADRLGERQDGRVRHVGAECAFGAGHHRRPGLHRHLARGGFAAHALDDLGRGAEELDARLSARGREVLVLGEKSVAGVNAVGAAFPGDIHDRVDPQVALAWRVSADRIRLVGHADMPRHPIALRIHGHRRDAHVAAGPDDPDRDLPPIRDENFLHESLIGN